MTTRITVSLLLIAVLLTAASATVFADGPPEDENEPVDQQQVETQETASTPKSRDVGGAEAMGLCLYQTLADWPHYSRSDVSAHGYWKILPGGDCPSRAWVTIWLYEWQCDDDDDCDWEQIGKDRQRVRAGGGHGRRATARARCGYGRAWTGFRATVDVDIPGVIDPPDRYSVNVNVDCRVSSSGRRYDD
ncbi:MAG: hypothetical protein F4Y44_05970 [Chloroflexi bacterium]|nr:hypothetical protein [Chloroflexota bacterium]